MSNRTMANKYAGTCTMCGLEVPAGEGIAEGSPTGQRRYGKPVERRRKLRRRGELAGILVVHDRRN